MAALRLWGKQLNIDKTDVNVDNAAEYIQYDVAHC